MSNYRDRRRKIKEEKAREHDIKYVENSKKSLTSLTSKRFKTVFVGAVAQIEQCFGELWGEDNLDAYLEREEPPGKTRGPAFPRPEADGEGSPERKTPDHLHRREKKKNIAGGAHHLPANRRRRRRHRRRRNRRRRPTTNC